MFKLIVRWWMFEFEICIQLLAATIYSNVTSRKSRLRVYKNSRPTRYLSKMWKTNNLKLWFQILSQFLFEMYRKRKFTRSIYLKTFAHRFIQPNSLQSVSFGSIFQVHILLTKTLLWKKGKGKTLLWMTLLSTWGCELMRYLGVE